MKIQYNRRRFTVRGIGIGSFF